MTKQEIQKHKAWEYINTLSPSERYNVIFYTGKAEMESFFNFTIREAPFTDLNTLKENELALSCQRDSSTVCMAVFTLKDVA